MLFRSKNREFGLNNWSCRCQPLLDLERPLFFSLYSSVFIWFRKLFERQLTDYTSSHTIKDRPQYLYLAGFTARSQDSHTLWRRPGMAGNGQSGTAALKATDTASISQHSLKHKQDPARQQGSKTLSFCFVAQVVSWNALEALWGQPSTGFKNIRKKHRPKRCERMNQKWRDMDQDYDYDDIWWLWAMKVSYYYRY